MLLAAKERFHGPDHDTEHGETKDTILNPLSRGPDNAGAQPGFGVHRWTIELQASIVRSSRKT